MTEMGSSEWTGTVSAQFERALALFRNGDDRRAHQAARAVLDRAPRHVGAMMLLLATAGALGDEVAISAALVAVSPHWARLVAVPEVRALLESDVMAPVAGARQFRALFAPALRSAEKVACDVEDRRLAREVQEAIRDAAVDGLLAGAPAYRPASGPQAAAELHLVDAVTRSVVGVVRAGRQYRLGRDPESDIYLDHGSVSRSQLDLELRGGRWSLRNLSRSNGTILNGKVIGGAWMVIQDGDELQLGDVTLDVLRSDHPSAGSKRARQSVPELGPEAPTSRIPAVGPQAAGNRTSPPATREVVATGRAMAWTDGSDQTLI